MGTYSRETKMGVSYMGETKLLRCVTSSPNQTVYLKCEDRISSLPDVILVKILSLLNNIREATRTSVLSQNWKHLWYNVPNYDFTPSIACPGFLDKAVPIVNNEVSSKVACCVNNVVSSSRASSINRFKVHYALDANYNPWIGEWLDFSMSKSVKELKLNFSAYKSKCCSPNPATLPSLSRYADSPSVHTLVSLTLAALCVTTDFLESLLFNFTNLEHLSMKTLHCVESEYKGAKEKTKTKVVGSKLRRLEITLCSGFGEIEICAEKLTTLVYVGGGPIKFSYVPLLNDASFIGHYVASLFCNYRITSGFSSKLSRLKLHTHELKKIIQGPLVVPNQFGNLKELELITQSCHGESLLLVTNFIDACPLLHKLKMQRDLFFGNVESDWEKWNWKERRNDIRFVAVKRHHFLNIFEMVGFIGAKVEIELILLLTQEAIPLEKIILDPNQRCYQGKLRESNSPKFVEICREKAKLLRNRIPSRVQVEVL